MSTLVVDTLTNQDNQLAKAWVNFDGWNSNSGGSTIRASKNISSITDNASADWTINFTDAMLDANYIATFGCASIGNNDTRGNVVEKSYDGNSYRTTTSIRIITGYTFTTGITIDGAYIVSMAIHR